MLGIKPVSFTPRAGTGRFGRDFCTTPNPFLFACHRGGLSGTASFLVFWALENLEQLPKTDASIVWMLIIVVKEG